MVAVFERGLSLLKLNEYVYAPVSRVYQSQEASSIGAFVSADLELGNRTCRRVGPFDGA